MKTLIIVMVSLILAAPALAKYGADTNEGGATGFEGPKTIVFPAPEKPKDD